MRARIGHTDFETSLSPKGDLDLLPVEADVRRAEDLELGDDATANMRLNA